MAISINASGDQSIIVSASASINDLGDMTTLAWYRRTGTTGGRLWTKGYLAANAMYHYASVGTTNITCEFQRSSGSGLVIQSTLSNFPIDTSVGHWLFTGIIQTGSSGSSAGIIYLGDMTQAAVTPSSYHNNIVGSGSFKSESTVNLTIGQRSGNSSCLDGDIAFIAIWNRILTQGEVWQQQWWPHVTPGCVLFMFPGKSGIGSTTQYDYSGYGNHGVINNSPVWAPNPPTLFRRSKSIRSLKRYSVTTTWPGYQAAGGWY